MLKSAPKIMVMEAKILRFFFKNFNLLNVLLLKLYYYFCFLNYYSGAQFNIFFVNKAIQNNKKNWKHRNNLHDFPSLRTKEEIERNAI
jgi:hypothetical protein